MFRSPVRGRRPASIAAPLLGAVSAAKYLILDTDLDSDCDDIHDLATISYFVDRGELVFQALTTSGSNAYSAPTARAMLDYLGLTAVPVGAYQGGGGGNSTSTYTQQTAAAFRPAGETRTAYESALRVLRRALVNCPDGSAYILWTGSPNNMGALIASPADDISPLTGMQLCQQKAAAIIGSAGYFDNTGTADEPNIGGDLPSANALATSGLPLVWDGLELGGNGGIVGRVYPGTSETVNPLKYAWNRNNQAVNVTNGYRNAWTLPGILYIVRPSLVNISVPGDASFDSSFKTTFTPNPAGKSRYLTLNATAAALNTMNETWTFETDVRHDTSYRTGGYLAYRKFEALLDAGAGATTQVVTDSSGKAHDGTLGATNAVASDDPAWTAAGLSFDGVNDFVNVPYSADFNPIGLTLCAVVTPTVTTATRQIMTRWGSTPQQFQMRVNAGNFEHIHQSSGAVNTLISGGPVTAGTPYLLTVAVNDKTVVLRKNGVEVARQVVPGPLISDTASAIMLGKRTAGDFFSGSIVYAAMFQRVMETDLPIIEARARAIAGGKNVTI